ncbi:MAG TPA: hypothetical protein VKV79_04730 [Terriglobia bacterium]|nr:hypothetical protein [Terriglobia bacterium]
MQAKVNQILVRNRKFPASVLEVYFRIIIVKVEGTVTKGIAQVLNEAIVATLLTTESEGVPERGQRGVVRDLVQPTLEVLAPHIYQGRVCLEHGRRDHLDCGAVFPWHLLWDTKRTRRCLDDAPGNTVTGESITILSLADFQLILFQAALQMFVRHILEPAKQGSQVFISHFFKSLPAINFNPGDDLLSHAVTLDRLRDRNNVPAGCHPEAQPVSRREVRNWLEFIEVHPLVPFLFHMNEIKSRLVD